MEIICTAELIAELHGPVSQSSPLPALASAFDKVCHPSLCAAQRSTATKQTTSSEVNGISQVRKSYVGYLFRLVMLGWSGLGARVGYTYFSIRIPYQQVIPNERHSKHRIFQTRNTTIQWTTASTTSLLGTKGLGEQVMESLANLLRHRRCAACFKLKRVVDWTRPVLLTRGRPS